MNAGPPGKQASPRVQECMHGQIVAAWEAAGWPEPGSTGGRRRRLWAVSARLAGWLAGWLASEWVSYAPRARKPPARAVAAMGADVSSCCGGGSDAKATATDLTVGTDAGRGPSGYRGGHGGENHDGASSSLNYDSASIDPQMKAHFRDRLERGIDVHLILQDKTKLLCQVRLDRTNEFILLSCEQKVRAIGMSDIRAILHTSEQLRRVETAAGITETESCAAIHLAASGNCIPLFFTNGDDKKYFVALVEDARASIAPSGGDGF